MIELLLVLHFTGLVLGASAAIVSLVAMRLLRSAEGGEGAATLHLVRLMWRIGSWGITLLFVTGPALVWLKYDNAWGALPAAFHVKMAAAVALVVILGFLHGGMRRARRGDAAAAARLPRLGVYAGGAMAVALISAVISFG